MNWDEAFAAMQRADIVVTGTAAAQPVVTKADVQHVLAGRRGRPLFLIDIAVPRDIEPDVRDLANVFLYDIDDLKAVAEANLRERRKEAAAAEAIVEAEVRAFLDWQKSLDVAPLLADLRQRAETIRRGEVERARQRLGPLNADQEAALDAATTAIVNKLLHPPTAHLKEVARNGRAAEVVELVRRLFGL